MTRVRVTTNATLKRYSFRRYIIGRSAVDKVDSYTKEPGGSRKVYVYGLHVHEENAAYVRLMSGKCHQKQPSKYSHPKTASKYS